MSSASKPSPMPLSGIAYNQVPQSENAIHGDDVAQRHGFRGGLVPGVTVSAYLLDPAVRAWGLPFLQRGRASVVVKKPLYDRDAFRTEVAELGDDAYDGRVVGPDDVLCAEGRVELPAEAPAPPSRRGDRRVDKDAERPLASREVFQRLRDQGMGSVAARWDAEHAMFQCFRDGAAMPPLLRPQGGGYANAAFLLGTTNRVLAANARMPAWLHVQTDSQFYAPVDLGTLLVVEAAVVDLFERKGHAFVDLEVAAFQRDDDLCVMGARLRAIYRLRGG
ncbi:MAG: hypothetical protein OXU20_11540 [Myxococcales bacterium]|nr:hypothetical protein [Myxococcales bacterium]